MNEELMEDYYKERAQFAADRRAPSPEQQAADKWVAEITWISGKLSAEFQGVSWQPNQSQIRLNGNFTPHQLIAIANHMLKHSKA